MILLNASASGFTLSGIPVEFIFFGLTLLGVALLHKHTLKVALIGMVCLIVFLELFSDFSLFEHIGGSDTHEGEWSILLNLFGLLTGFAVLERHFEHSRIPQRLPNLLPDDWKGGFVLLVLIFFLSSFLDNIAAAMIGGSIALTVYKGKIHMGYLVAIVAASNAGGSGSVLGDTTTTMMWIDGVPAVEVLHSYVAAFSALLFFGVFAALQQQKTQPIIKHIGKPDDIDYTSLFIVFLILVLTIASNIFLDFPAAGVWIAILIGAIWRPVPYKILPLVVKGSVFLLSLVMCASMMPVEQLPPASWTSAFVLGFVSSVFDNIPLTKLALEQGGYDWGMLAFSVGFGGSMIWFGSSAGVAISNMFPQARSVGLWVKHGWHVMVAYVIGFFILLWTLGWNPHDHKIKSGPEVELQKATHFREER
jgi:Na+/H+ antiporter NhaD/arsenite permease-like protein